MPDQDNEILKYVSGEKSLKVPFVVYADLILTNHTLKRKLRIDHWVIL